MIKTPSVPNGELNEVILFALKKHLILDSFSFDSESYLLGREKDFENTSVKISSSEIVENYFKEMNFRFMPILPQRCYLVACTDSGVCPIYNHKDIKKIKAKAKESKGKCEWKMLKISQKLYDKLIKEIDVRNKIIYTDIDAAIYDKLTDKQPKYIYAENITVIKRRKSSSCSVL